ncbi:endonuclease/exonuclease/phosphatase family protein [Mycobacteroides chelonae]|jgi:predicted extracellular nuclease|uniref:Endonuclease/exonuclease/phosphatase family protein n=1 Tax=Mycobacteroides chelonae TaxID=1774 RepID=A0AB73U8M6_MYCCH|nr:MULTISPECIES: endonuclease/exonuclease/phosphatase family protein [Mycobacteroides]KRQ29075.1 nuclease [Mycobacteroides sp. H072]KRQ38462.1 nuclease [Mycobacteroides sp. H002]KRQ49113.1 nuclease [Mycobacteroides sp. H054]KRQ71442.1 nuclease [Mycobacteroides sp. H001]MEC4841571.1 endonuclease/exonuclease/phosphatase family protein [Mycobacteroides chelonae]
MARTTFSVATFNMYNLQDADTPLYATSKPWTPEEFKRKTEWAAWQLGTLGADVVGLQEVWSKSALESVLAVDPQGLADEYDVLATPAVGTSITCAALVRKGLLTGKPKWITDFPKAVRLESRDDPADPQAPVIDVSIKSFSRPVLNFQVQLRDDEPATEIFVVHLKSKLPTQISKEAWYKKSSATYRPHQQALGDGISTIRRTAEAVAVRVLLNGVMRDTETPVVVLGDINDGKESNTANILTSQPRYLVGDSQGGSDFGLYSAQTLQEYRDTRDVYYTHVHQDLRESLDHVMVSEQFYDHSRKRVWLFEGLLINNDHLNFENHRETGTGDHGIVRVSFKHDPVK